MRKEGGDTEIGVFRDFKIFYFYFLFLKVFFLCICCAGNGTQGVSYLTVHFLMRMDKQYNKM
jgi:hypothetical protein